MAGDGGISFTAGQLSKAKEAIEFLSSLTANSGAHASSSSVSLASQGSGTSQNQASSSRNTLSLASQRAEPSTSGSTGEGETIINIK